MKLTFIFSEIYDFCKEIERYMVTESKIKDRGRKSMMHVSEVLTILTLFHTSGFKNFKVFYMQEVMVNLRSAFPRLPSYNRFIELKQKYVAYMTLLFSAKTTVARANYFDQEQFADTFLIPVCDNKRIYSHKVFKGLAARGKGTMGWKYGWKLHVIISKTGEIISAFLTPANIADNNAEILFKLTRDIQGKIFADRGYLVNQEVFKTLLKNNVTLVTNVRTNMKKKPNHTEHEKKMLKKRGVVESVGNVLKNSLGLVHSRHRSLSGFIIHIFSCLMAYYFKPEKPSISPCFSLLNV